MLSDRPPLHIASHVLADSHLDYRWDDWKASEDFQYDPQPFVAAATEITPRSRMALTLGLYEWVIFRLRFASPDPAPFQVAEAAWCAIIDRRYMVFYEFERRAWMGPVRGPLWCAMTWLIPAVLLYEEQPEELESGLSYLMRLAYHVVNDRAALENWTARTLSRLRTFYPAVPDDPFDDLFGEHYEERRGPLLPPEVVDPSFPFRPDMTGRLIEQFLRSVDFATNPFLKHPSTLAAEEAPHVPEPA